MSASNIRFVRVRGEIRTASARYSDDLIVEPRARIHGIAWDDVLVEGHPKERDFADVNRADDVPCGEKDPLVDQRPGAEGDHCSVQRVVDDHDSDVRMPISVRLAAADGPSRTARDGRNQQQH